MFASAPESMTTDRLSQSTARILEKDSTMTTPISRRSFLQFVGAAGAVAGLPSARRGLLTPAFLQGAKPFTIGINADISTLDPHAAAGSIVGARFYGMVFDQLTTTDPKGALQPQLATKWVADNLTWKFTLRPDVKFHDGTVMTAKDVAFSLNRMLGYEPKPIASPGRASFTPYIAKVEATGDLEVTITTKLADPLLPLRLATPIACVIPQAYAEKQGFDALQKMNIGAGPYKVVEYKTGDRMVVEAHKDYWGGAPAASQVTVRIIPEPATRLAAFLSGDVDLATTISPDSYAQLTTDKTTGITSEVFNWMLIYFNTKKGITSNVDLRKALSLGIDRQSIATSLWNGKVRVMNDYYLPGEFAYDATRPPFPFDLDAAKKALEASGYKGEELEFTPPATYYTNGRLVTDAINEMWTNLGVKVKYTPLDTSQWGQRSIGGQNIATLQSFGTQGDPGTGIAAVWNAGGWIAQYYGPDADTQKLINEAASSSDPAVRSKNYRAVAAALDRDVPIAPLYQSVEFYGLRKGITWTPNVAFYIDLRPGNFKL
jgi:peptide/nickel transport system substrate-binding protein